MEHLTRMVKEMRIIDADKLLECVEMSMLNNTHRNGNAALCHVSEHRHFVEMIVEQPTAFDVEKVVRALRDLKMRYYLTIANTGDVDKDCAYLNTANAIDRAIEIVKRGGRDEE